MFKKTTEGTIGTLGNVEEKIAMTPGLSRRLAAVKEMAIKAKNKELGNSDGDDWFDTFIKTIVKGTGFDDLAQEDQEMILEWKAAIRCEIKSKK